MRPCEVPACDRAVHGAGYCLNHLRRFRRHGTATGGRPSRGAGEAFLERLLARAADGNCVNWPYGTNGEGYGILKIAGTRQYAHRLVCERRHGPPPPDHQAAHSCGNGHLGCVAPWHLSWKTRAGNTADSIAHGVIARGSRHGRAKLSEQDVLAIRRQRLTDTRAVVAARFGVSPGAIGKIDRREKWGWL